MADQDVKDLAKTNPEWEEHLKQLGTVPRLRGDIPTLRKTLADAKRRMNEANGGPPGPPEGVVEEDITVSARDGHKIPVRIHKPKTPPSSGSPLIVVYHGGGYCLGDLSNEEMNCRNYCKAYGAVCLNVDYRLGPEHKFPAAVHDSYDVLEWAARNATNIGADPSKGFLIFGTSAGAGLSIIVSHLARDNNLSPPLTGVGLSIPTVFDIKEQPEEYKPYLIAYEQNKDAAILDFAIMEQFMAEYGADGTSKLFTVFAGPKNTWNFKNLPATVFWICGQDPLRDDGLVYERVLKEHGTQTKKYVYPGLPHSFWSFAPTMKISQQAVKDFTSGIGWLLEQKH